jgi:hypothetical protein
MQLHPNPIHAKHFTCNAQHRIMVTEHSDIRNTRWEQLYDDACDIGIVIHNPETGKTTRWYLHEELRDAERELQVTLFRPCPETLRTQPQLAGWEVHILND